MNTPKLNLKRLLTLLPLRTQDAHKGNFGHVLVVGGDYGYPGAPVLAALGALRVGAGLVTVASHRDHIISLNSHYPELMATAIDEPQNLIPLLSRATVVVLGPGLGRTGWSNKVYDLVINCSQPLVLDADALFFLANKKTQRNNWVLTPHPGEAATLLQQTKPIANSERTEAIQQLINSFQATVVLKGKGSLVGSPNAAIEICVAGNPGMASGGMGDLLSGIIAGLIAQGLNLDTATKLAVVLHATAGDLAAKAGQRGLIATDLLPFVRKLIS